MSDRRVLIYGNSGSGKTTMARALHAEHGLPHLDLDAIAWAEPGERLPLDESVEQLQAFHRSHASWVIEGSYGSLVEAAVPLCTELVFLNPGVDACVANCRRRPWEPEKYASAEEQNARLDFLLDWVRQYPARDDEYGLDRHRSIFDTFDGEKREIRSSA
jgi:adenylate kinase family enzyme